MFRSFNKIQEFQSFPPLVLLLPKNKFESFDGLQFVSYILHCLLQEHHRSNLKRSQSRFLFFQPGEGIKVNGEGRNCLRKDKLKRHNQMQLTSLHLDSVKPEKVLFLSQSLEVEHKFMWIFNTKKLLLILLSMTEPFG